MKNFFLFLFLLSLNFACAATRKAKDETLFFLVICGILLCVLAILYAFDFIKKIIKQHKEKKTTDSIDTSDIENIS